MENIRVDIYRIKHQLMVFLLFAITVVAAFLTFRTANPLFMGALIAIPFLLILSGKPKLVLVFSILLNATGLPMPGMSYVQLGFFGFFLLFVIAFLGFMLRGSQWKSMPCPEKVALKVFMAVIIMIMIVRGSGLKGLGSATWGGMMYVSLLTSIVLFLVLPGCRLSRVQLNRIVVGSLVFALIGALISYRGWVTDENITEATQSRLRFLTPFAYAFLPFALAQKPSKVSVLRPVLIFTALILFALTGDRKLFIFSVMTCVGVGYFQSKSRIQYLFKVLAMGLIAWVGLVLLSPVLPFGIQRAASVLPGVQVDQTMAMDALASTEWRLEVWTYCLQQAKEFLLIGRGSAFDVMETALNVNTSDIQTFSPWFAFQTRSYHSGPLSLLIDYGIPGFLAILCFTLMVFRRFWKYAIQLDRIDSFHARYALALCVAMMATFFKFYFIMGGIAELGRYFVQVAFIIIFVSSVFWIDEEKTSKTEVVGPLGENRKA